MVGLERGERKWMRRDRGSLGEKGYIWGEKKKVYP